MLTASSDGFKCKPYVFLPRKIPDQVIKKKFSKHVLCWGGKSWMKDEFTADYLERTFGRALFGKRLLVWDAFRCHISDATKEKLKEQGMRHAVVPDGCTKFFQVFLLFVYIL